MKKAAIAILLLCIMLVLWTCSNAVHSDPLPFTAEEDDGLFMTDRGQLNIKDEVVTAANITVSRNGFPEERRLGNVKHEDRSAAITQMTVGEFRLMVGVLVKQLPELLEIDAYRMKLWPVTMQQGAEAYPCWTYSLTENSLTKGIDPSADQTAYGRLSIVNDGVLAHILIAP